MNYSLAIYEAATGSYKSTALRDSTYVQDLARRVTQEAEPERQKAILDTAAAFYTTARTSGLVNAPIGDCGWLCQWTPATKAVNLKLGDIYNEGRPQGHLYPSLIGTDSISSVGEEHEQRNQGNEVGIVLLSGASAMGWLLLLAYWGRSPSIGTLTTPLTLRAVRVARGRPDLLDLPLRRSHVDRGDVYPDGVAAPFRVLRAPTGDRGLEPVPV